jgi:opacity protein-like surface antigen
MTRKTFSLALFYLSAFVVRADIYHDYYGQNSYYRPDVYVVPPGYSTPLPEHNYAYSSTTYSAYNPDGSAAPGTTVTVRESSSTTELENGRERYFRMGIGPSLFEDTRLTRFGVVANDPVHFKPGAALEAAAGYSFNPYLSADLEVGIIGAEVDHIKFFTFDHARYYNAPVLINAIGSYPLHDGRIVPYVGGGIGGSVAIFDTQNLTTPANPTINGTEATAVFAGQILLGVRFQLNPKVWLGVGYKYFTTDDPTWDYSTKFGMKSVDTHSFLFTFLWKF